MRFAFGDYSVAPRTWSNRSELQRFLENSKTSTLLLGSQIEGEREFFSISICSEPDSEPLWMIGICSDGLGTSPEILSIHSSALLLIGANRHVYFLSLSTKSLLREVEFESLFRSMLHDEKRDLVLTIYETGIAAFNQDGSEVWRFGRDVIESAQISERSLNVKFMDSESVRIDIATGREL
jgi:hypothetical protein